MEQKKRLVIGISGASGAKIGVNLVKKLQFNKDWETHLVVSKGAAKTLELEMKMCVKDLEKFVDYTYSLDNIGANIATGSFKTQGMVVVPCSMKSLAGIANGYSDNLLLRAADVTLKEKRKLVLIPRETPFGIVHLKNMLITSEYGAVLMPPMMTFYNNPKTIEDMVNHIVGKILNEFDIDFKQS